MLHRPLIALLLSLCLIWQVAFANQGFMLSGAGDAEHASMHVFDQSHHHHDEGGFHEEETPEAVKHVQFDGLTTLTAVVSASPDFVTRAPWSLTFQPLVEQPAPSPFLDGPERPPQPIV